MKTTILAGAAALALAITPSAMAQDTDPAMADPAMEVTLTTEQQTMYDAWPADRRTMYDDWDAEWQTYYWTLTPAQQTGWWALTDDQRTRVYAMTPEQRTAAWRSISAQMAGTTPTAGAGATAGANTMASGVMQSARINYVSNATVQSVPADQAPSGDVPVCSAGQTDNCINAWEAGRRGAGVTRPLDHWPGSPASEM